MVGRAATRPRHQPDPACRLIEHPHRQALQQRDPFGQRGGEIELAIHRAPGDLGDMSAQADKIGQLVEHLVFDDRRFEIGDKNPLAAPLRRLHQDVDQGIADRLPGRYLGPGHLAAREKKIAGQPGREPVRLGGR